MDREKSVQYVTVAASASASNVIDMRRAVIAHITCVTGSGSLSFGTSRNGTTINVAKDSSTNAAITALTVSAGDSFDMPLALCGANYVLPYGYVGTLEVVTAT